MELYNHQKKIISEDPKYVPIALGTGGGKTRVCLELAEGSTLIIMPKQQRLDQTWEENCDRFGIIANITVISKETFRRDWKTLPRFDTVIVDECHYMLGYQPDTHQVNLMQVPKVSQMFQAIHGYIQKHKPKRFYLASATPISKPMNLYAIGKLLGKNWDFYKFRDRFYIQKKKGWRTIWIPRGDKASKQLLIDIFKQKLGAYTGQLSDWFDVPCQTTIVKHFGLTEAQKQAIKTIVKTEADPLVRRGYMRSIENGVLYGEEITEINGKEDRMVRKTTLFDNEKLEYIAEKATELPKILIFANYIGQVNAIHDRLKKEGYNVSTLTGQTKNRGDVIKNAEEAEQMIVVAQAGVSSGYELKTFNCMIFASKSWKVLDFIQGSGRFLRADNLQKNLYIHLVVSGGVDADCHRAIMAGEDFQEKLMENL